MVQQDVKGSGLDIQKGQRDFRIMVSGVLAQAQDLGATDVAVEVSEHKGLAVSVRAGDVETVEQTRDRSLDVTLFVGQRRGSASTSDFSAQAILDTLKAAFYIASHTAEDPFAALPDEETLAVEVKDLQLHQPWSIDATQMVTLALQAERAAYDYDTAIQNSDGASVSMYEGHFVMGNSRGFLNGYPFSRHSLSVSPIAKKGESMQRDYWYSSSRDAEQLESPSVIGRIAAERAVARLSARRISTRQCPVLFEAPLACGLLGAFTQAVSGGALYRKMSFLLDSLGQPVFPNHINVYEDPFLKGGLGSSPFDDEGVKVMPRFVVEQGKVAGYFLSTYTARKLGMATTGNAGGSHNLRLYSTQTTEQDNFQAMLAKLGTGLLVTELIGQGVNYVTGDYSRGAFGYWVENGQIQHAVEEITIAGNLKDMFKNIIAVGSDEVIRGTKQSGSILISQMAIAGT